ncbi:major histocompatibility complex class I-related gene protein-like [Channa argus]|uniref:major histocompatibility complex class I-related gene protein-like n=1 Tax=Channa argus TaxID=215402 RepID=UPI0035208D33
MKTPLLLLVFFCHLSSPLNHTLKFFLMASSGTSNLPDFLAVAVVNDIETGYCDSSNKTEVKQDAWKRLLGDNPPLSEFFTRICLTTMPKLFRAKLHTVTQPLNQSGGVHILQRMCGCVWDQNTGKTSSFLKYGYDGEDFIKLDLKKKSWDALVPLAVHTKLQWDTDKHRITKTESFFANRCLPWLKTYVEYGNSSSLITVPPSVSLLQKSPSSPVSCHATGFYPDRATMFWRKDEEELHEDVDHGEILPNHDGTFQMRVDLNISSIKPEDWRRYDCVFQLSGVDDIITKLDKAVIRTNWVPPSQVPAGAVIGVVVGLMLLSVCITGLFIWWKKKKKVFTSYKGFRPTNSFPQFSKDFSSSTNSAPD